MNATRGIWLAGMLALGSAGCGKAEAQARAEQAERDAQEKAVQAQREADLKKAEAEREATEARTKAEAARAQARVEIQKELAAADRKVADLKERLTKAKGNVKLNAAAAAEEVARRRTMVENDLNLMNSATGSTWDELKAKADRGVDAVEEAVESFDRTLSMK